MLAKFKPFRYLQKLWCQPVSHRWVPIFGVATLVFAIGWLASSSNLQASIIANSSALETIRPYVAEVRTAQTDYRAAIGQGNGGAYDQYQSALLCTDQLDDKLQSLKELRGSYRRLGTQIGLREREQRLRALLPKVENQARTIVREIFTVAEEEALLMRADDLKLNFEKVTARLANCLETFKNVERCGAEIQAFLVAEEEIKQEILAIQNMSVEKEQEAQKRLEPLQKESEQLWYKSEQELFDEGRQLSSLWLKIQARQLKAEAPPSSGDQAIASAIETGTRIGTTIGNAAKIITSPLAGAAAMLGPEGILGAGKDIVNGISTGLFGAPLFPDASPSAGGGDGSGATTISGSDAATGLKEFAKSYKGNQYGSAIGMVTGWTNFLLPFVGAIAIAAIVFAGFLYLTAAGNQEQTEKAKKIIIWVVIGIIIIVSAYAIVNTVLSAKSAVQTDNQVDVSIGGTDINVGW